MYLYTNEYVRKKKTQKLFIFKVKSLKIKSNNQNK